MGNRAAFLAPEMKDSTLTQAVICAGSSTRTMKNRAIEIHDSTLEAVSVLDGEAVLHFSSSLYP